MGYWKERQEAMYKAGEMQVNQYFTRLEKAFNQTKKELQKTIEAFYFQYAEENGLSYAAAQRRLNAQEMGELQDFIDLAMQNIGKYNQTVNNLSIKSRITRYQALEAQADAILRQLYAVDYQAKAEKVMQEVYEDSYYRTWYNADQYRGYHASFAQVDPRSVEKLLEYPFNGASFSSRLWKQKDHLQTQLMEAVTTMMIQGRHPQTLTAEFAKKMQSKKFDAYRLLHTESSFLMSEAAHAGYREDGVEKYQILATLDGKTCGVCGDLDSKVHEVEKAVVGVNMPPFHTLCRCTDTPYYDDMDFSDMPRAARDPETGKVYEVPGGMTYNEWKAMVSGDKSGLQEVTPDVKMKVKAEELKVENFPDSFNGKTERKNTQALVDYVNSLESADANVVALYNSMAKLENIESRNIPFKISHAKDHAVTTYTNRISGNLAEVKLTIPKLQGDDLAGQVNTMLHEEMHLMDLYGRTDPTKSGNWFSTSRRSLVDVFKNTSDSIGDDVSELFKQHNQEWKRVCDEVSTKYNNLANDLREQYFPNGASPFSDIAKYKRYEKEAKKLRSEMEVERDYLARNIMGGGIGNLQDIYDALSGGLLRDNRTVLYGHGSSYYGSVESRVHETIANYAALSITRPDLIDLLRADKPDLVAELDATIIELLKKAGGE